ncbi:hypothetical protein [Maize yellow stripe virus]|nr:hypothetical protein [Maize yellow stripe virus]
MLKEGVVRSIKRSQMDKEIVRPTVWNFLLTKYDGALATLIFCKPNGVLKGRTNLEKIMEIIDLPTWQKFACFEELVSRDLNDIIAREEMLYESRFW